MEASEASRSVGPKNITRQPCVEWAKSVFLLLNSRFKRKELEMTHRSECNVVETVVQLLSESGFSQMAEAIKIMLNEAMRIERSQVLEAGPYERTERRRGHANGFKPKTLATRMGEITVQVPQTRGVEFYPSALEKGVRSERALKLAIAEMYVQGVSTRKVTEVMEQLCGLDVSSTQVSRATALLDEELTAWRQRPIGEIPYLVLDARYEKVRHGGSVVSCAVLIAVGITPEGHRSLLGVSVSLSEAEVHWRDFIAGLQDRGMHGVRLIVSDNHAGLKAARESRLPGVPWQRCQFHLQQNAGHYVPRIDMRPRVATLFPNEASLLRLVSAVLMEISEEWETEKIYLRMENDGLLKQEE